MTTTRNIRICNRNIEATFNNIHSVYVVRGNNVYTNAAVWEDGGHPSVTDDEWKEMLKGNEVEICNDPDEGDEFIAYGIDDDDELED